MWISGLLLGSSQPKGSLLLLLLSTATLSGTATSFKRQTHHKNLDDCARVLCVACEMAVCSSLMHTSNKPASFVRYFSSLLSCTTSSPCFLLLRLFQFHFTFFLYCLILSSLIFFFRKTNFEKKEENLQAPSCCVKVCVCIVIDWFGCVIKKRVRHALGKIRASKTIERYIMGFLRREERGATPGRDESIHGSIKGWEVIVVVVGQRRRKGEEEKRFVVIVIGWLSVRPVLFLVASPPEEEEAYTLGLVQNKKKKKKYTSKPLYINTQHTYTHSLSTIKASYKQLSTRPLKGYLSFFLALSLLAYTERERKRGVLYFSLGKEWGESMLAFGAGETVMSRVHPTATSLRENKKKKKFDENF